MLLSRILFVIGHLLIVSDTCQFVQFDNHKLAIPLNKCMEHRQKQVDYSTKYVCSNDNSMITYNRYIGAGCIGDLSYSENYDSVEINTFECSGIPCSFVSVRIYKQLLFEDSDSDCMDTQNSDFNDYYWIIDYCFANYILNKNIIFPNNAKKISTQNTHNEELSMKIECGFDSVYLQTYKGTTCRKHQKQTVIYDQTCKNDTYWEILACSHSHSLLHSCYLSIIVFTLFLLLF
eukprot:361949_1